MGIFLFLLIRVLYFLYKYKDIWIDIDLRQFLIEKNLSRKMCNKYLRMFSWTEHSSCTASSRLYIKAWSIRKWLEWTENCHVMKNFAIDLSKMSYYYICKLYCYYFLSFEKTTKHISWTVSHHSVHFCKILSKNEPKFDK